MKIKAIGDKVIVRIIRSDQTESGIIIPGTAQEEIMRGEVVAAGPGTKHSVVTVKKGDIVKFPNYAGRNFKHEKKDYKVMPERSLLGKE